MMGQVSSKFRSVAGGILIFWCPGCESVHQVRTGPGQWTFNGNLDRPTFQPSILVTSGHYASGHDGKSCWCTFNAEKIAKGDDPSGFTCQRCHTFVTDGRIQFLPDCSHGLAGQTIAMPDLPPFLRDEA